MASRVDGRQAILLKRMATVITSDSPLQRDLALDGLRGVAILLVLIWHECLPLTQLVGELTPSILMYMVRYSWSGVDLFFVLSGFLISRILLQTVESPHYYSTFFMRRFFRVLPLYYLLLGVAFGLKTSIFREMSEPYWQSPAPWWSYLTFTQNLFFDGHGVGGYLLGVTWSLAIEEQFYLFFPLIVRVMNFRFLVLFLLAAILAAPTMRELFGQGARLTFTLCRLVSFDLFPTSHGE